MRAGLSSPKKGLCLVAMNATRWELWLAGASVAGGAMAPRAGNPWTRLELTAQQATAQQHVTSHIHAPSVFTPKSVATAPSSTPVFNSSGALPTHGGASGGGLPTHGCQNRTPASK